MSTVEKFLVERLRVERSMFEKSRVEIFLQSIKSDVPIKEEPDGNIEDIPNEMVDIYYDQLEDWYETEEEPKPKKARRGRPSKNYNLSEQNSDEEWKDVKNAKRKIKGRPKKSEKFIFKLDIFSYYCL